MNYFAHGRHYVESPYMLAGTALPDWLSVVDRRVRIRPKHVELLIDADDGRLADLARGVQQHHQDDAWFHATPKFTELSWEFTARARRELPQDEGFRPSFLGHILVEILLDAVLIEEDPQQLEAYYAAVDSLDAEAVEQLVGQLAGRPVERIAELLPLFSRERFLSDYASDEKLCFRLNQVMRRVGLPTLPEGFRTMLPNAREQVRRSRTELLTRPAPHSPHTTTTHTQGE